jgi:hypothetical protein
MMKPGEIATIRICSCEARYCRAKYALRVSMSGGGFRASEGTGAKKPTRYMDGLRFSPQEHVAEPDTRLVSGDDLERAAQEGKAHG